MMLFITLHFFASLCTLCVRLSKKFFFIIFFRIVVDVILMIFIKHFHLFKLLTDGCVKRIFCRVGREGSLAIF